MNREATAPALGGRLVVFGCSFVRRFSGIPSLRSIAVLRPDRVWEVLCTVNPDYTGRIHRCAFYLSCRNGSRTFDNNDLTFDTVLSGQTE